MLKTVAVLALVASSVSAHTLFMRPSPYLVGGSATLANSASNVAPCGTGSSTGSQVLLADFPYWAEWDGHNGHNTQGLEVVFKLYDMSNQFVMDVQTSPFMTGNMYMDQIVISSDALIAARGGSAQAADGTYKLQLSFNDGSSTWYTCADVDIIISKGLNGFPADGFTLLEGTSATTGLIAPTPNQAKMVAYHPTFDFNRNRNDPYMFYRLTARGSGVTNKHVNIMANAFMLDDQASRTDVIESIPSLSNAMVKASTLGDGVGTTSLCLVVGNRALDNQWKYLIAAVPGSQATSSDQFSVSVDAYNAMVGGAADIEVAPHDGYMYYYTEASSAGGKDFRLVFTASTGSFGEGFMAELAEDCQMTVNRYVAMAASGDTECIDLPEKANEVYYIRTQNAQQQYRIGVEPGTCAGYDSSATSIAGSVAMFLAALALALF